jgi:hypothetical protein
MRLWSAVPVKHYSSVAILLMPNNLPYKEVYAYAALMRCSQVLCLQQQRHLSMQACKAAQQRAEQDRVLAIAVAVAICL